MDSVLAWEVAWVVVWVVVDMALQMVGQELDTADHREVCPTDLLQGTVMPSRWVRASLETTVAINMRSRSLGRALPHLSEVALAKQAVPVGDLDSRGAWGAWGEVACLHVIPTDP